jgi:hypothetical protein
MAHRYHVIAVWIRTASRFVTVVRKSNASAVLSFVTIEIAHIFTMAEDHIEIIDGTNDGTNDS